MRSALALSALLLLLLLLLPPLPSLSQTVASSKATVISTAISKEETGASRAPRADLTTVQQSITTSTTPRGSSVTSIAVDDQKGVQGSSQTTASASTAAPTVPAKPETVSSQEGTKDTTPAGTQSSHSVTANIMTAQGGSQRTPEITQTVNPTHAPPAASTWTTPASTQAPLSSTAPNAPGSSSEGPSEITTASRSPDTMTGHTPSQGTTNTPTTAPLVTSDGSGQISKMPAGTGTSPSITGASPSTIGASPSTTGTFPRDTLQPTVSSSGPVATPPVRPTSSSTQLAPTAPQGSNIPFPTSALENDRIKCEPPERLNETMLILNFTKTNLCAGSPPDDKLVTLLCRAAKANYNPSRDQCRIWLVPVLDIQGVAIKEIAIQTKLLPKDLYESLKDKWDDLKEVGVSNMQLGDQGPPEETEDRFSMPLIITIVCMASFLLLVAALYGCCHQRLSHRKDQQRLTEELQTVENGYHDNPTLEVMETSSEMQEKKVVNLNGELGDSWIVPLDNLMKDDLDEEEDTHL